LELVTNQVNILRGTSPSALHAMKGTCPVGHPYSETNTGLIKTGGRRCRSCDRIRKKNKYWSERGIAS
jgi:hypothetical protein